MKSLWESFGRNDDFINSLVGFEKSCEIGDSHYLAQFSNRVKSGIVLIEILLNGDPLYLVTLDHFFLSHLHLKTTLRSIQRRIRLISIGSMYHKQLQLMHTRSLEYFEICNTSVQLITR